MMSNHRTSRKNIEKEPFTKIIILGTYFGKWPVWFPAFLLSCSANNNVDWLFFTDCEIPHVIYPNVNFIPLNLGQLNDLASEKLGLSIKKGNYSQLDLRPSYGVIFEEYIKNYDFWGHCDIDVVWGDIRSFFTEDVFQNYDIVSPRKDFIAGHLTFWRNVPKINNLFKAIPAYCEILSSFEHFNFDEAITSTFLKSLIAEPDNTVRVLWLEQMVVWFRYNVTPNGWCWDRGKIYDVEHREHIYVHFQHYKKYITQIDFQVGDKPLRFVFTRNGIRVRQTSYIDRLKEKINGETIVKFFKESANNFKELLRLLKRVLFVRDIFWAKKLRAYSINPKDVLYDQKTEYLYLKRLDLNISRHQQYFLQCYDWAIQLVGKQGAIFSVEHGDILVEIAGVKISLQNADHIVTLMNLSVNGIYNTRFVGPTVCLDVGMKEGITSIFFATDPNVVVVGFEPYHKQYQQALRNIALNPKLSDKIQPINAGVGNSEFRSIAGILSDREDQTGWFSPKIEYETSQKFNYEEIEIIDIADVLDSIVAHFPDREIVLNIDLENMEYYIDGVSEYPLIKKLHATGKLNLIHMIILKLNKGKPKFDPEQILSQLNDYGFQLFLLPNTILHKQVLFALHYKSSPYIHNQQQIVNRSL
jgi:FkbM family methyltransferase